MPAKDEQGTCEFFNTIMSELLRFSIRFCLSKRLVKSLPEFDLNEL